MMNEEMITKAKEAKSVEELIALAKENGVELDEESAKAYFEQLHPKTGEVSDDELENVSGGGCHTGDGRLVVTVEHQCEHYQCRWCGKTDFASFAFAIISSFIIVIYPPLRFFAVSKTAILKTEVSAGAALVNL